MNYTPLWLGAPLSEKKQDYCVTVSCNEICDISKCAIDELVLGLTSIGGCEVRIVEENGDISLYIDGNAPGKSEGYMIDITYGRGSISAKDASGLLYGVFALLREVRLNNAKSLVEWTVKKACEPSMPLRMLNHWDNMDGSIERGYSGNSFFFENNDLLITQRTIEYARLMAFVGINGVVINNVNVKGAATWLISAKYYSKLKEISNIFSRYGITLYLSINYAAPIEMGELNTADPLDSGVIQWWQEKAKEVYTQLPKLGGFLVKADSEGREGPFTYGRNQAQGANMLAKVIKPFGGQVIWRCFVYNCQQDWRDRKTDRAKAGYDYFMPLDGMFDENVVLQIKNGPMDFQVREPVSPLLGGLEKTRMMIEFQIAQEYTGQQRHVCYLLPWFLQVLNTNIKPGNKRELVKQRICGMAAVSNTGNNENWTGHDLAAANLYGYGRMCFDNSLTAQEIANEWIGLTFGFDNKVRSCLFSILMSSFSTYEKYTAPLGIGWMVNPGHHYGPNVDGYEYDRWGTYHRADCKGIGIDRTRAGTGYCNQYSPILAKKYENIDMCPDELLLFFHHVSYTHKLQSGKTVIQHIYDTHFEGAQEAQSFLDHIRELEGIIEDKCYRRMIERFIHQACHAGEWRDRINTYFYRISGIQDAQGRKIY